jgi:hypothetical protein
MYGLLTYLQRRVLVVDSRKTINHEMDIYWEASELFSFVDVVNERSILMPHKPYNLKF